MYKECDLGERLGAGIHAEVFEHKEDESKVVKRNMGDRIVDPWVIYAFEVMSDPNLDKNPNFPTIHNIEFHYSSDDYITTASEMKKLFTCNKSGNYYRVSGSFDRCILSKKYSTDAIGVLGESWELFRKLSVKIKGLIDTKNLSVGFDWIDLHSANFMEDEKGNLVINDPYSDNILIGFYDLKTLVKEEYPNLITSGRVKFIDENVKQGELELVF